MRRTVFFVLISFLSITLLNSCSKDDDSSSVKNSLIGVWKTNMRSSAWHTIYIAPDGNLKYSYKTKEQLDQYYTYDENSKRYINNISGSEYDPTEYNAHWIYDESTNSISMYTEDGYFAFSYEVRMNDDHNSWVGITKGGSTYTFTRLE